MSLLMHISNCMLIASLSWPAGGVEFISSCDWSVWSTVPWSWHVFQHQCTERLPHWRSGVIYSQPSPPHKPPPKPCWQDHHQWNPNESRPVARLQAVGILFFFFGGVDLPSGVWGRFPTLEKFSNSTFLTLHLVASRGSLEVLCHPYFVLCWTAY